MTTGKPVRRIAIIGTGAIGASWSALFLAKGLEVIATDIAPNAESSLKRFVQTAWPALERLGLAPGASQSRLAFTADLPRLTGVVDRQARRVCSILVATELVCPDESSLRR